MSRLFSGIGCRPECVPPPPPKDVDDPKYFSVQVRAFSAHLLPEELQVDITLRLTTLGGQHDECHSSDARCYLGPHSF